MNIPNTITLLRILLAPLLVWLIVAGSYAAAIWVLLASAASDALDGFIARRFNMRTDLGALLDPAADKLTIVSSVLALAWTSLIPWWLAATVILRDLVIIGGAVAYYLRAGKIEMDPSIPSKLNTFVQFTLIFLAMADSCGAVNGAGVLPVLYWVALFAAIFSGGHYVVVWGRKGRELKQKADRGEEGEGR